MRINMGVYPTQTFNVDFVLQKNSIEIKATRCDTFLSIILTNITDKDVTLLKI